MFSRLHSAHSPPHGHRHTSSVFLVCFLIFKDIMAPNSTGWYADRKHLACGRCLSDGSKSDDGHSLTVNSCIFGASGKEMTANLLCLVSTGEDQDDLL